MVRTLNSLDRSGGEKSEMTANEIRQKLSKLEAAVKSESSDADKLLLDIKVCVC